MFYIIRFIGAERERERKEERIFLLISGGYGRKDDDGDDAALRSRAYWVAGTP